MTDMPFYVCTTKNSPEYHISSRYHYVIMQVATSIRFLSPSCCTRPCCGRRTLSVRSHRSWNIVSVHLGQVGSLPPIAHQSRFPSALHAFRSWEASRGTRQGRGTRGEPTLQAHFLEHLPDLERHTPSVKDCIFLIRNSQTGYKWGPFQIKVLWRLSGKHLSQLLCV